MDKVAIIAGKERRRRWTEAEEMRLVAETLAPGAVVAHIARRHEVAESCRHAWRSSFATMPWSASLPRLGVRRR